MILPSVFSRIESGERNARVAGSQPRFWGLAADARVNFHVMDGAAFIGQSSPSQFDFIYADALHPNTLVPDAVAVATDGQTQVLRIP